MATLTPTPSPSSTAKSMAPSPESPPKKKPTPSSEGQYILQHIKTQPRVLDPYDVKNIYRSEADIQRAIKNGTFTHSKVMHMDWTDKNIYFLCYENDITNKK